MNRYTMPIIFYANLETDAETLEEAERKLDEQFERGYYGHHDGRSTHQPQMNHFNFTDFDRQPIEKIE